MPSWYQVETRSDVTWPRGMMQLARRPRIRRRSRASVAGDRSAPSRGWVAEYARPRMKTRLPSAVVSQAASQQCANTMNATTDSRNRVISNHSLLGWRRMRSACWTNGRGRSCFGGVNRRGDAFCRQAMPPGGETRHSADALGRAVGAASQFPPSWARMLSSSLSASIAQRLRYCGSLTPICRKGARASSAWRSAAGVFWA